MTAIVGANVPDYRGSFLRGLGGNSAAIGILQGDAIRNIIGNTDLDWTGTFGGVNGTGALRFGTAGQANTSIYAGVGYAYRGLSFDASRVVPTANENRPINKAVLYIIRAK